MIALLVLLGIIVFIVLFVIHIYNNLVRGKVRVKEAWATVETQLRRRYDLIPNLVETVKVYAKYESKTLEQVISARNMAMSIPNNSTQKEQYENMLTSSLKSVFALSESYPDLHANQNFLELQHELRDTEDKIQATRQFYNTVVASYNTSLMVFPSNVIAGMLNFGPEAFFKLEESEKAVVSQPVKVQF